jgi:hypothetical protein
VDDDGKDELLIGSELVLDQENQELIFTAMDRKLYVLDLKNIKQVQ